MRSLLILIPFVLGSTAFAQTTWTVQSQSTAADFSDIQSAVDAASTGDTILIRGGFYDGFEIDGKGLSLVADEGATVSVTLPANGALIRVENLPAGTSVTMRGISIQINVQLFAATVGLDLFNNQGEIWLEEMQIRMFHPFTELEGVVHAARVFASNSVALVSCDFEAHTAAHGMFISNSNIYAYGSFFRGGIGRPDFSSSIIHDGGDGARMLSGQLFSADSVFLGGDGTDSVPFACTIASNGGSGVQVDGGLFRDRENSSAGGTGGTGGPCGQPDGLDGGGTVLAGGALELIAASTRGVQANSPVFEGDLSTQTYFGVPSEVVFTTIGFSLEPGVFFPDFAGPLLLGDPKIFRFCGLLNGSGTRTKSFTLQELGFDAVTAYFHPSFFDLTTSVWRSGTPASVTYMDSGFAAP